MTSSYQVTHYPRCVLWGPQLTRPTTAFARGCKLWSRERRFYEDERLSNMQEFSDRPYLHRQVTLCVRVCVCVCVCVCV